MKYVQSLQGGKLFLNEGVLKGIIIETIQSFYDNKRTYDGWSGYVEKLKDRVFKPFQMHITQLENQDYTLSVTITIPHDIGIVRTCKLLQEKLQKDIFQYTGIEFKEVHVSVKNVISR